MSKRVQPHLVTGAAISREQEFRSRQRRYLMTMGLRIALLVVAALVARYSMAAAILIGLASAVLPWIAVLMANDGPPKSSKYSRRVAPHGQYERALAASPYHRADLANRIIDESGATLRPEQTR